MVANDNNQRMFCTIIYSYSDTGQCDASDKRDGDADCDHDVDEKPGTVRLNNGQEMPLVGLGTAGFTDQKLVSTAVDAALKYGYRLIGGMFYI